MSVFSFFIFFFSVFMDKLEENRFWGETLYTRERVPSRMCDGVYSRKWAPCRIEFSSSTTAKPRSGP